MQGQKYQLLIVFMLKLEVGLGWNEINYIFVSNFYFKSTERSIQLQS